MSLNVMAIIFSILVYFIFYSIKESILFSYVKIMLQVTIKFLNIFLKIPNTIFKFHEDIHVQQ